MWTTVYEVVRVVVIVLDVILICVFVFSLKQAFRYRQSFIFPYTFKERVKGKFHKSQIEIRGWKRIQKRMEEGSPQSLTIAVIEADKLVDEVLKDEGYSGEFLAQRIEALSRVKTIKTIDKLWQAHRIRNNLVHTPGFELSKFQGEEVIKVYEVFLRELGAL